MNNKISVYGSTGFIGSRFCNMYSNDVIPIDREKNNSKTSEILYFISTTTNYNIFNDPFLDIETNLHKLIQVLEANKDKKNLVFNFISSWFVYGKTKDIPAHEDTQCNPKGFYSITKRTAEQLLISYCETHSLKYRIFRLSNVIGETDMGVSKKKNALQYMIKNLAANETIQLYDGGEHIRDYMYVDDTCEAIMCCIKKAPTGEIINIGSGRPIKIKTIIEYCKNKLNSNSIVESVSPPNFHKIVQIENMYLDIRKLSDIGYTYKNNFWDAIDKIMEKAI